MVSFDAGGTLKPIFDAQGNLQQFRDIDPDNPGTVDSGSFLIDAGNGYIALVQEMDVTSGLTTIRLLGPDGTLQRAPTGIPGVVGPVDFRTTLPIGGATDFLRLDRALWADSGELTSAEVLAQFAQVVGTDRILTFDNGESITLQGFTALVAADLQLI